MPNIPIINSTENSSVGAPDSYDRTQASPGSFGGSLGAALGEAGQQITQGFGELDKIVQQRQTIAASTAAANFDFTPTMDKEKLAAGPGAVGFHDKIGSTFDETVNTYLNSIDDPKAREEAKRMIIARKPGTMEYAANYEAASGADDATNKVNAGLDAVQNRVRTDPAGNGYEQAVIDGQRILDATPGLTSDEKSKNKVALASNLAGARFEAMIENAKTPADIDALRNELASPTWAQRFTSQLYDKTKDALDTAYKSLGAQHSAQAGALVANFKERNGAGLKGIIPEAELQTGYAVVANSGTPEQQADMMNVITMQNVFRDEGHLPPFILRLNKQAAVNGEMNTTDNTKFLMSRLQPGHPSYYITNMKPALQSRLTALFNMAPEGMREKLQITSGARSESDQVRIRRTARPGYAAAGTSEHTLGNAADIGYDGKATGGLPPDVAKFIADNASKVGLKVSPWQNGPFEPWHVELQETRGGAKFEPDGSQPDQAPMSTSYSPAPGNFRPLFETAGAKYGIPPEIGAAMAMQESHFRQDIITGAKRSPSGAVGLMQTMPATAKMLGIDPTDPAQSVDGAMRYLATLQSKYKGNLDLALAAYNWGEGHLDTWIKNGSNPYQMPKETRDYVSQVHAYAKTGALDQASAVGVSNKVFQENKARDIILNGQTAAFGPKGDMMTYSADNGMTQLAPLDTPENITARGQSATQVAAANQIPLDEATPLTTDEVNEFSTAMQSDQNGDAAMKIMADLQALGPDMSKAAFRQLNQTSPVFQYAASTYDQDNGITAGSILRGQKRIDADSDYLYNAGATPSLMGPVEQQTLGAGFSSLNPADSASMVKAARAYYANEYVAKGGKWNQDDYIASLNAVTGNRIASVNGAQMLLPPGTTEDDMHDMLTNMTVSDWTAMSAQHLPPRYLDGTVAAPDDLATEAHLNAIDGSGNYHVTMADNNVLITGRVNQGGAEAYILHLDAKSVKDVADRPVGGDDPTNARTAVPPTAPSMVTGLEYRKAEPPSYLPDDVKGAWAAAPDEAGRKAVVEQWQFDMMMNGQSQ